MGVQVDQPRHDVPAGAADLQDAGGLASGDVRGDPGDLAAGDRDVQGAVQPLAGVQDVTALDQQVVGHAGHLPHSRSLASSQPWAIARSLAQTISSWPTREPMPQSVPACTFSLPTTLA